MDVQTYWARRDALIAADRSLRRDVVGPYSEDELEADKVVREMRTEEATILWADSSRSFTDAPHTYPGMEFLNGKHVILQSNLVKIISKVVLHCPT